MEKIKITYNNKNVERIIEIDPFDDEMIFITIRKGIEALDHEFEDVLLTKSECRNLCKILSLFCAEVEK